MPSNHLTSWFQWPPLQPRQNPSSGVDAPRWEICDEMRSWSTASPTPSPLASAAPAASHTPALPTQVPLPTPASRRLDPPDCAEIPCTVNNPAKTSYLNYYMQQEPIEDLQLSTTRNPSVSSFSLHHGPIQHDLAGLGLHRVPPAGSSSASPRSAQDPRYVAHGVDIDQVDERLRGLSLHGAPTTSSIVAGQRVSDYENALSPPTPRQALGFKVIKRPESGLQGPQLEDFPNEILTHILSHLHPDSHAAVSLVSKRFYTLVTTPHAWRMAFMRYFPGHDVERAVPVIGGSGNIWGDDEPDTLRSETRYFSRLSAVATWRSEYLMRTRLMRSLARGKPSTASGGIGSSVRSSQSGRKASAVLTYNSKLPWLVTHIHAVFSNGKKPPRAIQGAGDLGLATISDPTTGKIEKWGLEDGFTAPSLELMMPNTVPYGLGEGPTGTPNVMDVSQPYGMIVGEGFAGGRAYFRGTNDSRGWYLGSTGVVDTNREIPKIPEMSEAICSVWLAKSSLVPTTTKNMIGMLTGSTLGVVTAYSLGSESAGSRYQRGEMTARWVLSPGVPIVSLKVDEYYSYKRNSSKRVWAVALNALGEVYYLTETPPTGYKYQSNTREDAQKDAWYAGRSVYWHLVEPTRRVARPDDLDKNVLRGTYSPRSPAASMSLSKEQTAAEAREIEKFFHYKPAYFRKVCQGWDMQRKLEVDFARDDGHGAGESIFVIDCGLGDDTAARVARYTRSSRATSDIEALEVLRPTTPRPPQPAPSLFGAIQGETSAAIETPEVQTPRSPPPTPATPSGPAVSVHSWHHVSMDLGGHKHSIITASALDNSSHSQLTLVEDPLHQAGESGPGAEAGHTDSMPPLVPGVRARLLGIGTNGGAPHPGSSTTEIPGRRARMLAIGTNDGAIVAWNAREEDESKDAKPLRTIQTDSPQISSLATSALYLVHGGSDGLVQAWDLLGSTKDAVRTLNGRSSGRVPRHMTTMNPTLRESDYSSAAAIFLDPDPSALRGIVSFGAFLRYWSYSSKGHPTGRKRRLRHSDIHGRVASRRLGGALGGYIAAEEAELRHENAQRAKEQVRLRNRFGAGAMGDLTEEEALRVAQMMSEDSFLQDEQRRASDSAADASLDTASSFSEMSTDTITPEPSVTEPLPSHDNPPVLEDEYEQEIMKAIRLSLMECGNDTPQSPQGHSSGEYEFSIKYKAKGVKKGKRSPSNSPGPSQRYTSTSAGASTHHISQEDEDLALALSLSMQDQGIARSPSEDHVLQDEFPPLETQGVGKGKGIQRW
ncbi:hypothetical protein B0I35DRAFT_416283 [Stachybotrys elegans]|uniref:F-box domain-containing protein n=1 Tax=Stachybotrys elegans TaxID=80388 RepID=A0A8K0WWB2_9HYPO|nr:hypothetical protein B0I35DRAFT_416283 [Stachybotrys elegans]